MQFTEPVCDCHPDGNLNCLDCVQRKQAQPLVEVGQLHDQVERRAFDKVITPPSLADRVSLAKRIVVA